MRAPSPTWEATYSSSRRAHRHRCRLPSCNKIIADGEPVLMVRLRGYRMPKTWALHTACACAQFGADKGWTWRDAFEAWGTDYLRKCGWKLPEHPMMCTAVKPEAA